MQDGFVPRVPHTIALVALDAEAQSLLDDFADAMGFYAGATAPRQADAGAADVLILALSSKDKPFELPACAPGARVYAIAVTPGHDPHDAAPALAEVASQAERSGAFWCGGLLVGGGRLVARHAATPRMGFWRRPRSEAIDRLIFAVVAGERLDAPLVARCPVPGPLYRLL